MKVIFFNTYHNGDLLFTKEFIRTIVNNNSAHKFYIWCRQFYSLYGDIDKLEVLERPDDTDVKTKSPEIDLTKKYYIRDETLYLNAIAALNMGTLEAPTIKFLCNSLYSLDCLNKWFSDIINGANTLDIEPKLVFNNLTKEQFLPSVFAGLKLKDLPEQIKTSLKTPCIFYYNTKALTQNNTFGDDDKNIESIAAKHPSYTVIVAKETNVKVKNVISLYDLDIKETDDGKNLLMYAFVASFCPVIVSKETGGALVIFNRDMMSSDIKQHIIMLYLESVAASYKIEYGYTLPEAINNLMIKDNKHLIPLGKYDTESLLGEIDKIGEIQAPTLPLDSSGGSRYISRRPYITNKSKRKRKNHNIHIKHGITKRHKHTRNMRFRKKA
jgi:hypothetical protein